MSRRIAVLAAVIVLASACGAEEEPEEEDAEPEQAAFMVNVTDADSSASWPTDDEYCAWEETTYVLRDGEGATVATGNARSTIEGEVTGTNARAEIGEVVSEVPYECVMSFEVEAEESEFYEVEVTTQNPITNEEMTETAEFSREDARKGVDVEFS
ncbi:hypothetical protein F4561_002679 [Lipingzhangella halophila]|uniref:Lipoprotein n=1 Tax=Lipingzhangella halophila TaxID=1783352 RepID=A0A7W7W3J0_9ACTN|nr:hypothetical protein [Lipingzhangella halophila]MBB4931859.1 hypothetical protein [Lipingzhangella halophila]